MFGINRKVGRVSGKDVESFLAGLRDREAEARLRRLEDLREDVETVIGRVMELDERVGELPTAGDVEEAVESIDLTAEIESAVESAVEEAMDEITFEVTAATPSRHRRR